jgi:hypothetical protein
MAGGFGPKSQALAAAMTTAFDHNGLANLVFATFDGITIDQIAEPGTVGDRVVALMQWAQQEGYEQQLVDAVVEARPGRVDIQAAAKVIRQHFERVAAAVWYEPPDAFETCFIRSDWPFINRLDLRRGLRSLIDTQMPRTLVVRGTSGSGRSYSSHYVAHVVEKSDQAVLSLDLALMNPGFSAQQLAGVIAASLGRAKAAEEEMPRPTSTDNQYNLKLANWLVYEISGMGKTWWVLLDGFDKDGVVPPDTAEFVVHLMRAAEMTERQLRVVLLGCGDVLPPDLEQMVCSEQIETIEPKTVEEFWVRFADHKKLDASEQQIKDAVKGVFDEVPEDGRERLPAIHAAVRKWARTFPDAPAGT